MSSSSVLRHSSEQPVNTIAGRAGTQSLKKNKFGLIFMEVDSKYFTAGTIGRLVLSFTYISVALIVG